MTKLELIYNVREILKLDTDDVQITDDYISHLIDIKRVKVLQQRLAKTPWRAPIEFKQELCLELEVTDSVDGMSCMGNILRTKEVLPNLIRFKGSNHGITIRTGDRTHVMIDIVSLDRLPFIGFSQFTQNIVYAAFDYDNRVYLLGGSDKHKLLKNIRVGGIYENVEIAGNLECNVDSTCEIWEREYPLEVSMIDDVVKMVVQDLGRSLQVPEDNANDSRDKNTSDKM